MKTIDLLKLISDINRLRVLNLLFQEDDLCVCVLEETLGLNQSNLSRHLSKLRKEKIIDFEKRAQWKYYFINKDIFTKFPFVLDILKDHLNDDIFRDDISKSKGICKD